MSTDRDFAAEMRAVIDAETAEGPYEAITIAQHIADKLRATDAELLYGYLDAQAVQVLRHAIVQRDASRRSYARIQSGRSVFRQAADAAELGDAEPLSSWMSTVFVVEDGTRVRLAEMRKPDLLFTAGAYERRAADNALQAAFLNALAKKVGSRKVSDVFSEEKLAELWQSISER